MNIILPLRRLFFAVFPCYHRIEKRYVSDYVAEKLIRESAGKSESLQWRIASEQRHNPLQSWVHIERRERITQ